MRTLEEIAALEATQEKKQPYVTVTTVPSVPDDGEQGQASSPLPQTNTLTDRVHRWWLWELTGWAIAVLSLMGIVVLLRVQSDKPVPNWKIKTTARGKTLELKITINAVISIFSTVLKSTITIPIAASMSQMKWLWFRDGNRLSDVQLFDAANRGPLGSVILIWQMRGRQIVCLGALVVITMLGLDFSFQSLVTYPLRAVRTSAAYTPVTNDYSLTQQAATYWNGFGDRRTEPVKRLKSAMRSVINDIDTAFDVSPNCPTGNCTWTQQYASVGVCSECYDATDILNKTCGLYQAPEQESFTYCNYSWPGTESLSEYFPQYENMIPGIPWIDSTTQLPYTALFASVAGGPNQEDYNHFFKDFQLPLTILSVLSPVWDGSNLTTVKATQCALKMCVKKYEGSMTNTIFTEKVVDVYEDKSASYEQVLDAEGNTVLGPDDKPLYTNYTMTPPESFFNNIDASAARNFSTTPDVFAAITTVAENFRGSVYEWPVAKYSTATDPINFLWSLTHTEIDRMMNALAGNMTNAMRMSNANSTNPANAEAAGDVLTNLPYVSVHWAWIALPVVELILTLIFLLLTMRVSTNHKGMLWKGSALAPFYYPLTKEGRRKVGDAASPRQMEVVASDLKVQWDNTPQGLRLVTADAQQQGQGQGQEREKNVSRGF